MIDKIYVRLRKFPYLLALIKNLIVYTNVKFNLLSLQRKLPWVFIEPLGTELCLPYSSWLHKLLRNRLQTKFDECAFIGLCYIAPSRSILDLFKLYDDRIANSQYCLKVVIQRCLNAKILHDASSSEFSYEEAYNWGLEFVVDLLRKGVDQKILDLLRWFRYISPPPLVGTALQLEMAKKYRYIESFMLRKFTEYKPRRNSRDRIKVGIFRYDYNQSGEVDLLFGLLKNVPNNVDIIFLSFAERPTSFSIHGKYVCLTSNDLHSTIQQARDLDLDAVIYSAPIWGNFCSPMTQIIEARIAKTQIYYLGDVITSGFKNLDYILFPDDLDVEAYQEAFTEKLLQVRHGHPPTPPFFAENVQIANVYNNSEIRYVTNCHIGKINDELISTWTEILQYVPNSKIILCPYPNLGFKQYSAILRRLINKKSREKNIDPRRFEINESEGPDAVRKILSTGQVYLGTYPYTGCFSTAEAIRIGLPSVCLVGNSYHSQLSSMAANVIGLKEDVLVYDPDTYVKRAIELGLDKNLRQTIQEKFINKLKDLSREKLDREFSMDFWAKVCSII